MKGHDLPQPSPLQKTLLPSILRDLAACRYRTNDFCDTVSGICLLLLEISGIYDDADAISVS